MNGGLARCRLSILASAYSKAVIEILHSGTYFSHSLGDGDYMQHATQGDGHHAEKRTVMDSPFVIFHG